MENQYESDVLKSTKNFFMDSYQFEVKWDAVSERDKFAKLSRLYRWLEFMNNTFMHNSVPHYNFTINALLDLWKSSDILYQQTIHEFNLSLKFYTIFFHQVRNNIISIEHMEVAKKIVVLSYLFSKYHGMMQNSIHNQLANLSNVINENQLTDIIIKSFVKYETPHYLIANIQKLTAVEIQFLMELIQGKNLRKNSVLPNPISKQEFSSLMSLKLDSNEFKSHILLRGLIILKISNGQEEDYNLITSFLISSNTFNFEPLKYLNDISYWQKAFRLLVAFFKEDLNDYRISDCVDFLEYERYKSAEIFSLKGRTEKSLLRITGVWHNSIFQLKFTDARKVVWTKSLHSDNQFSFNETAYCCSELNSGELLYQEGQKLKHCVMTYLPRCENGQDVIWSFKKFDAVEQAYVSTFTIEVFENDIIQIAGIRNLLPNKLELAAISYWAEKMEFIVDKDRIYTID
jgi:hypothetical protein